MALYGSNIFNFDTTPLDPFDTEFLLCDQCQICRGPLRKPDQNRRISLDTQSVIENSENISNTSRMPHCTHSVFISRCGIAYMYQWLKDVGEDNRHKLRHLTLSFMDPNFAMCVNDTSAWEYRRRLGGDLVCKGLELLSQGHQLQTLEIETFSYSGIIEKISRGIASLEGFFIPGKGVRGSLSKITGLKKVNLCLCELLDIDGRATLNYHRNAKATGWPKCESETNKKRMERAAEEFDQLRTRMTSDGRNCERNRRPFVYTLPAIAQAAVAIKIPAENGFFDQHRF